MMGKNNYQDWTKEDLIQEIKRLKKRKKYGLVWEEEKINAIELANKLRNYIHPIFARIEQDRVLLDMRTVYDEEVDIISQALENIFNHNSNQGRKWQPLRKSLNLSNDSTTTARHIVPVNTTKPSFGASSLTHFFNSWDGT